MALRECDKCGEMVDEAKAFCPGCGRAFVEETVRTESSEFNMLDGTMQLGNTMYNQMLSDMGLNISAAPDKPAETAQPVQPAVGPPQPVQHQVLQPARQQVIQPAVKPQAPVKKSSNTWLVIGGGVIVFLVVLLIAAIAVGIFLYSKYG